MSGGGGDPPRRATPWVNLGGGWLDRFVAGGVVDRAGVAVARVQLR